MKRCLAMCAAVTLLLQGTAWGAMLPVAGTAHDAADAADTAAARHDGPLPCHETAALAAVDHGPDAPTLDLPSQRKPHEPHDQTSHSVPGSSAPDAVAHGDDCDRQCGCATLCAGVLTPSPSAIDLPRAAADEVAAAVPAAGARQPDNPFRPPIAALR